MSATSDIIATSPFRDHSYTAEHFGTVLPHWMHLDFKKIFAILVATIFSILLASCPLYTSLFTNKCGSTKKSINKKYESRNLTEILRLIKFLHNFVDWQLKVMVKCNCVHNWVHMNTQKRDKIQIQIQIQIIPQKAISVLVHTIWVVYSSSKSWYKSY